MFLVPSAPPSDVVENSVSGTDQPMIMIIWEEIPCSDRNGIIQVYPYMLVFDNDIRMKGDSSTTSVTVDVSSLNSGTYTFSVAGMNGAGTGPYANITITVGLETVGRYLMEERNNSITSQVNIFH